MKLSDELRQKIAAVKAAMLTLKEAGHIDEAHAKIAELEQLKNELDIALAVEAEEASNFQGVPAGTAFEAPEAVDETVVFNKRLFGKPLTQAEQDFVKNQAGETGQIESDDARGGYLVPKEQQTQIHEFKRGLNPLKGLCNVIPVGSNSGSMPIEVETDDKLINFDELTEIHQGDVKFGNVTWKTSDYGDIIPVSRTLLADEKANLTAFLGKRFSKKAVRTENAKILEIVKTATQKAGTSHTAIKTALNKELDVAIANNAIILTNQSGFDWLDKLEDKQGRPLVSPDVTNPSQKMYDGKRIVVVSDSELAPTGGASKYDFYVGDISEFVAFFDRQGVEMARSEEAGFTKNAVLIRVIERFDVQKVDAKAMVKVQITPGA